MPPKKGPKNRGCGTNVTRRPGIIRQTPHRNGAGQFSEKGRRFGGWRYTPNRLKVGEFCDPYKR